MPAEHLVYYFWENIYGQENDSSFWKNIAKAFKNFNITKFKLSPITIQYSHKSKMPSLGQILFLFHINGFSC